MALNFNTFRSLRNPNFRLFFTGQLASLIGTWMGTTAISWMTYRLTGSEALLGLVIFANQVPAVLITPLAGVYVDRFHAPRLLKLLQCCSMLQSFALAILAFAGALDFYLLMALGIVKGIINGFDMPARQALLPLVVKNRDELPNAIALNSAMFNCARLIGPALGGITIALVGETLCFFLDGLSFAFVIYALTRMDLPRAESLRDRKPFLEDFIEGIRYVKANESLRSLLLLSASVGFFGPTPVLLAPVFVKQVFHGGASLFGLMTAASGLGALIGALHLASRGRLQGLATIIAQAGALLCLTLCAFGLNDSLPLAFFLLFLEGLTVITVATGCNTIIQLIVEPSKRGRVLALYTVSFLGMMPLGSLATGLLAEKIGAPFAILSAGLLLIPSVARFAVRLPRIRTDAQKLWQANSAPYSVPGTPSEAPAEPTRTPNSTQL